MEKGSAKMNKFKAIISLLLILILCFSVAACGSNSKESMTMGSAEVTDEFGYIENDNGMYAAEDNAKGTEYGGIPNESRNKKNNLKLVYRAEVYLQTLDFDKSLSDLEKLVSDVDGYFENRRIDNGSYYRRADFKSANFTIRVPSEKYQDFLNSVSGSCHVVSISQNIEDIGDSYYDTENRIKTLQIKEERLQALLAKATKMSDIIELESALSENEYSLDMYKTQLRDYDSLVDYSTITVSLESVDTLSEDVNTELSFGERLARSIKNGAADFTSGMGSLVIWLGYNILNIVLLLIIAAVIIRYRPLKSFINFIRTKRTVTKSARKTEKNITDSKNSAENRN